ncbi:MAG: endonuclease V [Candidatus Hodarchaeales archaeon]
MKDILSDYSKIQSINSARIVKQDTKNSYSIIAALSVLDDGAIIRCGVLIDNIADSTERSYIGEPIKAEFPYVSSFLSLRYKYLVLKTLKEIKYDFDVLLIYPGSGIQHPRGFGLASDIGLEMGISVVGITKRPLVGITNFLNVKKVGNSYIYPVYFKDNKVALFIRKEQNKNGIFVSVGHNISLETSGRIVIQMLRYRLPEPIREIRRLIRTKGSLL